MPEDELGNGYEYLIKKFADDSGHTAQEFYTNRTLVHLMAQMLEPRPGESIYDPTCGTGGMLISCLAEVKRRGGDIRTTGLYGQELITITAAIARMNLVIHGVDDFHIASGNTLATPAFVQGDRLRTFDVVLAKGQVVLGEMLDQVLERAVGHLGLVGPVCVAEDALQAFRVCGLNGEEGRQERPPHIARYGTDVVPMRAFGHHEAVVGGVGGIALVAGFIVGVLVIPVPDVRQAFEEQQRKDVLLVVAGIDEAAQQGSCAPEIAFKFALGQPAHCSHPPSTSTLRR